MRPQPGYAFAAGYDAGDWAAVPVIRIMPPGTWLPEVDAAAGKMPATEAMAAVIVVTASSRAAWRRFLCRLGFSLTLTPFAWAREARGRRGVRALRRPCAAIR